MNWQKDVPQWDNPGVTPPQAKRLEGWKATERPPADWWNWFMNRIAAAVKEIRDRVSGAAQPDTIAARDANGRLKAAAPVANDDLTTKAYVDDATGGLATGLGNKADRTLTIQTNEGLTGGGDLSANRTIGIASGGATDPKIGNRTPDQSLVPAPPGGGTLTQVLSWLANRILAITGAANWWENPATTLKDAKTHADSKSGHVPNGKNVAYTSRGDQAPSWTDLADKPVTFPPSAHGHPASEIAGTVGDSAKLGGVAAGSYATRASVDQRWRDEAGFGVAAGLGASPGAGLTVSVAAGRCYLDGGTRQDYAAPTLVALAAAHASFPRRDVLYVDVGGVIRVVQGVPAAGPAEPAIPATGIKLAVVTVGAAATNIPAGNVSDQRRFIVGPANGRLVLPVGEDMWAT